MIRSFLLALALCITLVGVPVSAASAATDWEQRGGDIDGATAGDESGYSVALSADGLIVAVGEWKNTGPAGAFQGQVRVYQYSAGSWSQLGSDLNGEAAGDYFGTAVALSEDGLTLAVGAPFNDGAGANAGHVRVFTYASNSWSQLGTDIDGQSGNDQFGSSVALSADGRTVATGAPLDTNTGGDLQAGQVSVYAYTTSWNQVGSRGDIEGESGDLLGHLGTVDISDDGTVVAVGARLRNDGATSNTGALEVYALSGGAWVQRGTTQYGDEAEDRLGYGVSLSADGTVAAAGAIHNDAGGLSNAGEVKVFAWDSTSWSQRGSDIDGLAANDLFGQSLSLDDSGTRLAIGSHQQDTAASNAGQVRVFDFAGGSWSQVGTSVDGESAEDNFGISVALSDDGSSFAAGAHKDDEVGVDAGHVRVYILPAGVTRTSTAEAGIPGIYLVVSGPVGRSAHGSPVYYGTDRVATTSTYLLTITDILSNDAARVLATGTVDARGNLEASVRLPALSPGTYDVVFQGKHRGGTGLRLTARVSVGESGQITQLVENAHSVW
jgi:hypothetical protein